MLAVKPILVYRCLDVMEVGTDSFFHIFAYIQLKLVFDQKKCWMGSWFCSSVVDWMEADLNPSLQSIVRKGWGLWEQTYSDLSFSPENVIDDSFTVRK